MSGKRVVLAGVLAVLYPGLGHVYLREWLRAGAWFGLALVTALLVIPSSTVTAFESGGLDALLNADLPLGAVIALFAVRALNVLDAVLLAHRTRPQGPDVAPSTCPNCGGELDDDLDFCPWCTTGLEEYGESATDSAPEHE